MAPHDIDRRLAHESAKIGGVDDMVDLRLAILTIWRKRIFILSGTLAVTVLAGIFSFFQANVFQSPGFLLSDIDSIQYAKVQPLLARRDRFLAFLEETKSASLREAERQVGSDAQLEHMVSVWPGIANTPGLRGVQEKAIGYQIIGQAKTPEAAQHLASSLGSYISDCILYSGLKDYINNRYFAEADGLRSVENRIRDGKFKARVIRAELSDMLKIKARYPTAPVAIPFFSSSGDSKQYVSPSVEIVRLEAELAELDGDALGLAREKEMRGLEFGFFTKAQSLLTGDDFISGHALFEKLRGLQGDAFKEPLSEAAQVAQNSIKSDLAALQRMGEVRFADSPELPIRKVSPHRSRIVMTAALSSLLGLGFLVLLIDAWENSSSGAL